MFVHKQKIKEIKVRKEHHDLTSESRSNNVSEYVLEKQFLTCHGNLIMRNFDGKFRRIPFMSMLASKTSNSAKFCCFSFYFCNRFLIVGWYLLCFVSKIVNKYSSLFKIVCLWFDYVRHKILLYPLVNTLIQLTKTYW
jgi:hypothetical protein